jgi:outer membrane protein W
MKKILGLALGLLLASSTVFAAGAASSSSSGNWFVQVEGGLGIPISSQAATVFSPGFSGEAQVGYAFSKDFSLSVESGFDSLPFNTTTAQKNAGISGATFTSVPSLTHIPLELVGQYNISTGGSVTPYVLVGVGVCFDSAGGTLSGSYQGTSFSQATTSQSYTNFELDPGIGVSFEIAKQFNIFVQGKLDMDFGATTGANAESTDNPIMIIPVEVGLNLSFM